MTMGTQLQQTSDFEEVRAEEMPRNAEALQAGVMRSGTKYSTAMQVMRRRDLIRDVLPRCESEAAIAGDDFYYSWSQGGKIIEGLTVGAALAIARNMGNNAVDVDVSETPAAYYFSAVYIDLETGFNLRRVFRQNKQSPKTVKGEDIYKGDRGQDIIFQIGQSKAIRNVTMNAVPNWLSRKVMEKAKENVAAKIEKMGVVKASQMLIDKINALGLPMDRIVRHYGASDKWDVEKLVMLSGAIRSIEDGRERVDDVFQPEPAAPSADVQNAANAAKEAAEKATAKKPAAKEAKP